LRSQRLLRGLALASSAFIPWLVSEAQAQTVLPEVVVTSPSPIRRARPQPAAPSVPTPDAPVEQPAQGTLPIVTDQFATVTVVPKEELTRTPGTTLGDILFSKPGVTGSSFAPGASSRPIIRGLDVNRVGVVENGMSSGGASDLGEDHFVPVDPATSNQIEVIRGPATLRYGSQSIGGVVSSVNNRVPEALPCPPGSDSAKRGCGTIELRGGISSVDSGADGAMLLDGGIGQFAFHADAFGRTARDYRVPSYPYRFGSDPATGATQPDNFTGRQPNSSLQTNGGSIGTSYLFPGGFFGVAVMQNDALYHIPGIDGETHQTRIDAHQTKLLSKGEYRPSGSGIDAIRFWAGYTDYIHYERGLATIGDPTTDGVRQIFSNKEFDSRIETRLTPFDLRFAALTTAIGIQVGHQMLDAPSPNNFGLWDPNHNTRVAAYMFNEFKFSEATKAQIAGRIEHASLSGTSRVFDTALGLIDSVPTSVNYTPKSVSISLIQNLPWNLVGSITAQRVERAPKPTELFSGGGHDATATFDKGNTNLGIETANSIEFALRRAAGPIRFEATVYYTRFNGFIYRRLTGDTCNGDTGVCGGAGDLREAIYSQANATFRGGEFQSQWDVAPLWKGVFGIENQFDVVRATFTDGSNVPRIPPMRVGGGIFYRDAEWLARINLLHAFAQNNIATIGETPTSGYDLLKAEVSRTQTFKNDPSGIKQLTLGIVGNNLLNQSIRNHVSYTKDEVLMPGASLRLFANAKF